MCIDVEGDTGYLSNVIGKYKASQVLKNIGNDIFPRKKR